MIKRLLIVLGSITAILIYSYLHGRLWELMSPDKFGEDVSIFLYTVAGIPIAIMFTMLYFLLVSIIYNPIILIINYIAGKDILPTYYTSYNYEGNEEYDEA